jgi:hypothetical protein
MRRNPKLIQYVGLAIIVMLSAWIAMRCGRFMSDFIILRVHYGSSRVHAERLRIERPGRVQLRISNGDILGRGYAHWAGAIWAIVALPTFAVSVTLLHSLLRRYVPWIVPEKFWTG